MLELVMITKEFCCLSMVSGMMYLVNKKAQRNRSVACSENILRLIAMKLQHVLNQLWHRWKVDSFHYEPLRRHPVWMPCSSLHFEGKLPPEKLSREMRYRSQRRNWRESWMMILSEYAISFPTMRTAHFYLGFKPPKCWLKFRLFTQNLTRASNLTTSHHCSWSWIWREKTCS